MLSSTVFIEDVLQTNKQYLLRTWGVAVFFGALTIFGVVAAIRRGDYLVPGVVAAVVAFIFFQRWRLKRRAIAFFQDTTPDRAVAYYRHTMPRAQHGAALAAYMCSLVHSFYGEYEKARDELAAVAWTNYPQMYDGFRTYVLSIIALLEKEDFPKALDLALEARDLCSVPSAAPGRTKSKLTFDAHVLACELHASRSDAGAAAELERAIEKLDGTAPIIPAWSLVRFYHRTGQDSSAQPHAQRLRRLVPHCKPLTTFPYQ